MIRIKYAIHHLLSCAITLKKINSHFVDTEFLMEIYCNCKKLFQFWDGAVLLKLWHASRNL